MSNLRISNPAVIGSLEENFELYFNNNAYEKPIVIDLSDITFIEIASMVYFAQLIQKRDSDERQLSTRLILPESDSVMVILHTWRFFEIIEELTGKHISNFVEGEFEKFRELKLEIENKTYYKDINNDYFEKYYTDKGVKILIKKGFFSLVCLPFKTEKEKRLALKSQRLEWRVDKLIADVLERNLFHKVELGNLLANTIIYECLTNAARHPKSSNLVIGSFFQSKKIILENQKKIQEYDFTIVFWENGKSIIDTLKEPILLGENIRSDESFRLAESSGLTSWFKLKRDYKTLSDKTALYYDFIPSKEMVVEKEFDDEILVSSFFPGISRDPERKQPLFEKDGSINESDQNIHDEIEEAYGPGLGLTFLLDAVVGKLEGTLSVRTNKYFLNIKKASSLIEKEFHKIKIKDVDSLYQAKLVKRDGDKNNFVGNMITIRIPLKYEI